MLGLSIDDVFDRGPTATMLSKVDPFDGSGEVR